MLRIFLSLFILLQLLAPPARAQNLTAEQCEEILDNSRIKNPFRDWDSSFWTELEQALSHPRSSSPSAFASLTLDSDYHLDRGNQERESTVRYFDARERAKYKIHFVNGLAYNSANRLVDEPNPIYAMDLEGNLYLSGEQEVGVFHHTSFLAGGAVAGAGHMQISKGRILRVDNNSGHYKPPEKFILQVVEQLVRDKADLTEMHVLIYGR